MDPKEIARILAAGTIDSTHAPLIPDTGGSVDIIGKATIDGTVQVLPGESVGHAVERSLGIFLPHTRT